MRPDGYRTWPPKADAVFVGERQRLWNWAEAAEVARDARPAQRFQMSFSRGLTDDQNKALLREYVSEHFTSKGLIADVAIHEKKATDGLPNRHAHVLVFTREVSKTGALVENKHRDWTNKKQVRRWRAAWADKQNTALEADGSVLRVNPHSYASRGLDIVPGEHMGPSDWNRDQRGDATEKGQQNAAIEAENQRRDKQWAQIGRRVRQPEYADSDIAAYYERQAAQEGALYEPNTQTRDTEVTRIIAAEKASWEQARQDERRQQAHDRAGQQLEAATTTTTGWGGLGSKTTTTDLTRIDPVGRKTPPERDSDQPVYAARQTHVGWFGLGTKTSTVWLPGDASRPRQEREQLEQVHNFRDGSRQGEWERFQQVKAYHAHTFGGFLGDDSSGSSTRDLRERMGRARAWASQRAEQVRDRWRSRSQEQDNEPER